MREQLKLFIDPEYMCGYVVINDNYDGTPDSNDQKMGQGKTPMEALANYFEKYEADPDIDYVIRGADLI